MNLLIERYETLVSNGRRARANASLLVAERRCLLLAELLVRRLATLQFGSRGQKWSLLSQRTGQPYLRGVGAPRVSLSHSAPWVAASISVDQNGVDIEQQSEDGVCFSRHTFNEAELAFLESRPDTERTDCFYRLWTRKEAMLKTAGLGMGVHAKGLGFLGLETEQSQSFVPGVGWCTTGNVKVGAGVVLGWCCRNLRKAPDIVFVQPSQLSDFWEVKVREVT